MPRITWDGVGGVIANGNGTDDIYAQRHRATQWMPIARRLAREFPIVREVRARPPTTRRAIAMRTTDIRLLAAAAMLACNAAAAHAATYPNPIVIRSVGNTAEFYGSGTVTQLHGFYVRFVNLAGNDVTEWQNGSIIYNTGTPGATVATGFIGHNFQNPNYTATSAGGDVVRVTHAGPVADAFECRFSTDMNPNVNYCTLPNPTNMCDWGIGVAVTGHLPAISGDQPDSTDHYMTYTVTDSVDVQASVELTDQFGPDSVTVGRLKKLLVPVLKTHPPRPIVQLFSPNLHYKWWAIATRRVRHEAVRVLNQFSANTRWRLDGPQFMLAPALKGVGVDPPDSLPVANHYLCYRAVEDTTRLPIAVQLEDQFQFSPPASVNVREPDYFCAPCQKDSAQKRYRVIRPDAHLALYKIDPSWQPTAVRIRDQFGLHAVTIKQDGLDQEYVVVPSFKTRVLTGVGQNPEVPQGLRLSVPVPNPSGAGAAVNLSLPRPAWTELVVFDGQGRRVRTLREGTLPAGTTRLVWDGRNDAGKEIGGGVYFLRVTANGAVATQRVVLRR